MRVNHLLVVLTTLLLAATGAGVGKSCHGRDTRAVRLTALHLVCTSPCRQRATKESGDGARRGVESASTHSPATEALVDHLKRAAISPIVSGPSNVAANILTMHGTIGFCGVPGQGCPNEARRTPLPAHEDKGDHRTTEVGRGTVGFCGVPGQGCAKAKMGQGSSTDGSSLAVITESLDPMDDENAVAPATTSAHGATENYRPPTTVSQEQTSVTPILAIPWAPSTLRTYGQRLSSA